MNCTEIQKLSQSLSGRREQQREHYRTQPDLAVWPRVRLGKIFEGFCSHSLSANRRCFHLSRFWQTFWIAPKEHHRL